QQRLALQPKGDQRHNGRRAAGRTAQDPRRQRATHLQTGFLKGGPMQLEDMILVSVDDHVVEPPGMWDGRVAKKYADEVPKLVTKEDGNDVWAFRGAELPNIGLNAVAGRPPAEYGIDPTSFADMRPGCFDIKERVRDMNANGVLGSLCFPSMPGFCGQLAARVEEEGIVKALLQGYNDWHIDEWCGTYPGRFIPLSLRSEERRVGKGC